MKWSERERLKLRWILINDWCMLWRWTWAAKELNKDFKNNRTPAACRSAMRRWWAKSEKIQMQESDR